MKIRTALAVGRMYSDREAHLLPGEFVGVNAGEGMGIAEIGGRGVE